MKNKIHIALLTIVLVAFATVAPAQSKIGVKFFGLSVHPQGDENAFLMPRKLDAEGVLVINLGGMVSYEKFVLEDKLSVKGVQALYSDCAAMTGGFTHVGLRARIFKNEKNSLYGGIGPTIIYRENWHRLPGYINLNYFDGSEKSTWQYKFLWYGGEFEYSRKVTDKLDASCTFIPGYPKLMSLSFGTTWKL